MQISYIKLKGFDILIYTLLSCSYFFLFIFYALDMYFMASFLKAYSVASFWRETSLNEF